MITAAATSCRRGFFPFTVVWIGKSSIFFNFYDMPPCNRVVPKGHSSRRDSGITRSTPATPCPRRTSGHQERQEDHITGEVWGTKLTIQHPSHHPHPGPGVSGCSAAHPPGGTRIRGGQTPRKWRKPKRGMCLHKPTRQIVAVSAVPTWPNSPELFADKGFIFLSQRCNRKTNTVKPLELLPAWAECRGTLVAFAPMSPESPNGTSCPAQNLQWAQPQNRQPRGLPKTPCLGSCAQAEGMGNQELVAELLPSQCLQCQGFQPYPKQAHIQYYFLD